MSIVESLWNFFISMIWRLWICYAVIVFVHVKYGGSTSSNSASEGSKTNVTKVIITMLVLLRIHYVFLRNKNVDLTILEF